MQMLDRLARFRSSIDYRAVPLRQVALAREPGRHRLQSAQHHFVSGSGVCKRTDMFARADQQMRRGLRTNIFESKNLRIFVYDLRWDLLRRDLAEKAIGAHRLAPVSEKPSSRRITIGTTPSRSRSCSPNSLAASSPD